MAYHSRTLKLAEFSRLLILVTLCIEHGSAAQHRSGEPTSSIQQTSDKVRYLVKASTEGPFSINSLVAKVGGKTYEVVGEAQEKCMQIVDQRDFSGGGANDALVRSFCGGNCCPAGFLFVSSLGNGQFKVTEEFADSWDDPVIETWKGHWSVVVVSKAPMNVVTRRFVLENGNPVMVEEKPAKTLKTLVEMRADIFKTEDEDETHGITYDLDGDGRQDRITGRLWLRWHSILWSVTFADGKKFESHLGCSRIGVLRTKTHGVHDLVCEQDTVLHWNGHEYQE